MKPLLPALAGCVFLISVSSAHADDSFRARMRQRIVERMSEKRSEAPDQAGTSLTEKIEKPGDYYFTIAVGGLTRAYHVHVPPGYRAANPAALLFAFHGGGGDMEYMAKDNLYGLVSKSDKEGFIVVFPNGYSKFPSGKLATWNAGACCGDARDKNVDDIGFIRAMVAQLESQLDIDKRKIFATGMSNGGMMAQRVACELPDIFSAVASVAGTDNTLRCNPSRPISVLNIHAENDDHVLFNGGAGAGSFKDPSKVNDFTSVPETVAVWAKRNSCPATPHEILKVDGAYCEEHGPCADGTKVRLCVTKTGGHSWPGGSKPRGETPSRAISANDEMWKFFQSLN